MVEYASDDDFDAFVRTSGIAVDAGTTGAAWSFDDRIRLINYARTNAIPLSWYSPNESNSPARPQTIPNNLETISDEELMRRAEPAAQPHPDEGTPILDGWSAIIKAVLTEPPAGAKGE